MHVESHRINRSYALFPYFQKTSPKETLEIVLLLRTISYISDNHQELEKTHNIFGIITTKTVWTPYTGTFISPIWTADQNG